MHHLSDGVVCAASSGDYDSSSNVLDLATYVERFEQCSWKCNYIAIAYHIMVSYQNYHIYYCFFSSLEVGMVSGLSDNAGEDNFTILPSRYFWWLINIHPSHLIFQQDRHCRMEAYTLVDLPINLVITSFTWAILTRN